MSKMLKALHGSLLCGAFVPAPALAAPNVFWTFGFDRHYTHGTGGRAQMLPKVMLAARLPARSAAVVPDAVIAPVAPARVAQNDASTGKDR